MSHIFGCLSKWSKLFITHIQHSPSYIFFHRRTCWTLHSWLNRSRSIDLLIPRSRLKQNYRDQPLLKITLRSNLQIQSFWNHYLLQSCLYFFRRRIRLFVKIIVGALISSVIAAAIAVPIAITQSTTETTAPTSIPLTSTITTGTSTRYSIMFYLKTRPFSLLKIGEKAPLLRYSETFAF